ncbi:MAG TPA: hypothetical protein DD405_06450 [Desulfobacteraceae bacterium]|nr:hypothetical protein [Desulfobacteraceae bacterium]
MGIQPEGEALRKAVKYIAEERKNNSHVNLYGLIEKACLKFNLSPKEEDFLLRTSVQDDNYKNKENV